MRIRVVLRGIVLAIAIVVSPCSLGGILQTADSDAQEDSGEISLYADFGFAGGYRAERWFPVTVWLSEGRSAGGGSAPVSGLVIAEYPQDVTQVASIATPFVHTPGALTPVRMTLALPEWCRSVTFRVVDDTGRLRGMLEYAHGGGSSLAASIPAEFSGSALVVSVGDTSATRTFSYLARQPSEPRASPREEGEPATPWDVVPNMEHWTNSMSRRVGPRDLPFNAIAYESIDTLIVKGSAAREVDRRSLEAIQTWVHGGGRLLIHVDEAGDEWKAWLGELGSLLDIDTPSDMAVPASLSLTVFGGVRHSIEGETNSLVDRLRARVVRLSPRAVQEGWRAHWSFAGSSGLLVSGRHGYGTIAVLGFEPERATRLMSSNASAVIWIAAHNTVFGAVPEELNSPWHSRDWRILYEQSARASVLNYLANVPSISGGAIIAIALCVLVLAGLLGPIDYFALKRLRILPWSWATAMIWIALASVAAFVAPQVLREGPTRVNRLSVIDRIIPPGAIPGASGLAYRDGCTAIFSNESGLLRMRDVDPDSWWRSIAAAMFGSGVEGILPRVRSVQRPGVTGNTIEAANQALWTFRTYADSGRIETALSAQVQLVGEEYRVLIAGVPEGARVEQAALRLADGWADLTHGEGLVREGVLLRGTAGTSGLVSEISEWTASPADDDQWNWYWSDRAADMEVRPSNALHFLRPRRRSDAINDMVQGGAWAAVYLVLEAMPPEVTIDRTAVYEQTTIARLVVRIEQVDGGLRQ